MKDELDLMLEKKATYDHDANRAVNALAKFNHVVVSEAAPDNRRSQNGEEKTAQSKQENTPEPSVEKIEEDFGNVAPPWVKKAFRQIALRTHPDKVNNDPKITDEHRERLIDLYREASEAYQSGKYETIAEIAAELDIDIDLPPDELERALESKIASIRNELTGMTKTLSWAWGLSFGDIPRRVLILRRMSEVMKVTVPDEQTLIDIVRELESMPDFDIVDRLGRVRRIKSGAERRKVGTRPEKRIR